jgi:hypothetical protein
VIFVQSQADDVVTDLVNNVVLALVEEDVRNATPTKTNITTHGTRGRFIEIRVFLDEDEMEATARKEIQTLIGSLPEAMISDLPRIPDSLVVILVLLGSLPSALEGLIKIRGIRQIGY